jgi:hypothetical protein
MRAISQAIDVTFIVLEQGPLQSTEAGSPVTLVLTDKGQIMATGDKPIAGTIFMLYSKNHFNLLVPRAVGDRDIKYTWAGAEPSMPMFFQEYKMLPDHSCGWTGIAISLNVAKIQLPEEHKEPEGRYCHSFVRKIFYFTKILIGTSRYSGECFPRVMLEENTTQRYTSLCAS